MIQIYDARNHEHKTHNFLLLCFSQICSIIYATVRILYLVLCLMAVTNE